MRTFLQFLLSILVCCSSFAQSGQAVVLRKLLIAGTEDAAARLPSDKGGETRVFIEDLPVLAGQEFIAIVAPYFGKPLTLESVNEMAGAIKQFAIKRDRVVNIIIPNQSREDIQAGVMRLAVVVSRYDALDVKGNRWFSSQLLREKLGIKLGDEISISRLDEAVNWTNTNPFRRVQVALMPIENRPGSNQLLIGVVERIPVRLTLSYDDTGNKVIGRRRYTGALQFGNFLGRDHQLSYQFSTTDHQHVLKAHGLNYQVPLPWRHRLDFTASYSAVNPTLLGGLFNQEGKNAGAGVRYTIPVRGGDNPLEYFAGLDYKQSNNNLIYGGFNFGGVTDVFQASAGLSAIKRDSRGLWAFGLTVNLSPGNFNSRNTDDVFQGNVPGSFFQTGRDGAHARYAYGTFSVQRVLNLGQEWQWISRGTMQLASTNLVGGEQLSIGGSSTVRGFDERILTADAGFVVSNDLMAPPIKTSLARISKKAPPLETRFLVFYDGGHLRYTHPSPNDITQYPLASSGVGVRMSMATNLNVTADYGWQITRLPNYVSSSRNRGHVKVVLAY